MMNRPDLQTSTPGAEQRDELAPSAEATTRQPVEPLLLGRRELATALGISSASVDRLDAAGKLPRAIRLGGRKLWSRLTIEEFIRLGCPSRVDFEARTVARSLRHTGDREMSIPPRIAAVQHEPEVCGLDAYGEPPTCPGCAAQWREAAQNCFDDDLADHQLRLALGLPRRPRILDRNEQTDFLMKLFDIELTCRRRPEFGKHVRALLSAIAGGEP